MTVRDKTGTSGRGTARVPPPGTAPPPPVDDHLVLVSPTDTIAGFLGFKLVPGTGIMMTLLNPGAFEQIEIAINPATLLPALYPVADNVFRINDDVDPTKFLNVELSGQATGTTQTITTTATISRPFRLPDISGTAVVQQDATGQVFMGIGVTGSLHASNAGVQYSSITANRGSYRANQYGNNAGVPGITAFKSRAAAIGGLVGVLPGDVLGRFTAIGVAPDNLSIPLAGYHSFVVPAAFVPAAQDFVPTDWEVETTPLAGPINSHRIVLKATSEGETQTLRGVRAGGPFVTPAALTAGALISSATTGHPDGLITGRPGDVYLDQQSAGKTYGAAVYLKASGVDTTTGWMLVTPNETTTNFVPPLLNAFVNLFVRDTGPIRVGDYVSVGRFGAFLVTAKLSVNQLTIQNDGRATQSNLLAPEPPGLQVILCPKPQARVVAEFGVSLSAAAGIDFGPFTTDSLERTYIEAALTNAAALTAPQIVVEGFNVAGVVSYHRFVNVGDPNNTVRVHIQNNSVDTTEINLTIMAGFLI